MALEPIDYTTHSREIEQAYLNVVRGNDPDTTWLIISPNNKKEYIPEFTGSDFSEFLQEFDDTKVQYGLARVCPPGSDVEKLILIGWCPDSAPLKTRASFASNFGAVANQVLRGYHVQVTARDEDDLDEKELLMKISNAAGARYSIQQATKTSSALKPKPAPVPVAKPAAKTEAPRKASSPTPVVESTKPTITQAPKSTPAKPVPASAPRATSPAPTATATATPTANSLQHKKPYNGDDNDDDDDDDWDEPELEERDFRSKPLKPNQSSWKPVGKIDLQKIIAEETAKTDPRLVNIVSSEPTGARINPQDDIEKLKQESKLKRDAELSKFLGTKAPTKEIPKTSDDLVIKGFRTEKSPAQLWAEKKQKEQGQTSKSQPGNQEQEQEQELEQEKKDEEEEEKEQEHKEVEDIKSKFEKMSANEPLIIKPKVFAQPSPVEREQPTAPSNLKQFGTPLPGLHSELDEEEAGSDSAEDDWDDDDGDDHRHSSTEAAVPPSLPTKRTEPEAKEEEEEEEEPPSLPSRRSAEPEKPLASTSPKEEDDAPPTREAQTSSFPPPPPPRRASPEAKEKETHSPSAVAEYDYEAGEENELTFTEGDKIINIEFVDDDWWLGELEKTGEKGLFPSNYVELAQQTSLVLISEILVSHVLDKKKKD